MAGLIALGKLRELVILGHKISFSRRDAPIVAYDSKGRIQLVYPLGRVGLATPAETREYAKTHWGQEGEGTALEGIVAPRPFRMLGKSSSIVYETRKGLDADPVEYEHEWGEGRTRGTSWAPPSVGEHTCRDRKCKMLGTVALVGGTYRVTPRGIVG